MLPEVTCVDQYIIAVVVPGRIQVRPLISVSLLSPPPVSPSILSGS